MEQNIAQYREKAKRYYDADGKLAQYPSKRPLRILVLMQLARGLEPERKYTEKEVNEIIQVLEKRRSCRGFRPDYVNFIR